MAGVKDRFDALRAEAGTVAHDIHAAIAECAVKIEDIAKSTSGMIPSVISAIQHLEQAAHGVVSSPSLNTPAESADPTPAGTNETAPADPSSSATSTSSEPASNGGSTS